ncbi:MAG: acyl-CoA dehydrogenase family protein, partial [Abyssibacter sp.]
MPAAFDWSDPLRLEDQLEADERAMRDAVRAYARDQLMPRVVQAFRHAEFDREILREMGGLGMLGLSL